MWPADGNAGFFLAFSRSTHLGNSLENHSRVIVVGIRVDEVHRTPCRVLHSFDLHHPERKEEWWEGQKGQQDTHVNGFELVVSLRVQIYCGFLGHLLAVDELL